MKETQCNEKVIEANNRYQIISLRSSERQSISSYVIEKQPKRTENSLINLAKLKILT